MDFDFSVFKDYDVRGIFPTQINPDFFYNIAKELVLFFKPKTVCLGWDVRNSSLTLAEGMEKGFMEMGVDVIKAGTISTDMIYFIAGKFGYDLNIVITGSHAKGQNGFKVCQKGAIPVNGSNGLYQIRDRLIERKIFPLFKLKKGRIVERDFLEDWINHSLSFVDIKKIKPLKVVIDAGNGVAGLIMEKIEEKIPGDFINLFFEPDGSFPNHFPNPLIEENLRFIKESIKKNQADLGIAFDADGDRAFILDEKAQTINGNVLTALLAKSILQKEKGPVLYNAVCGRIVPETVKKYGGEPIRVRVGHSIIKQKMREFEAIFAGEHSGHFYFKQNYYSDSGLIAVLKVLEVFSKDGRKVSQIVREFDKYPRSGEINFKADDKKLVMKKLEEDFSLKADKIDWLDGITVWFDNWWFNVRPSNTEPLLRLNMEADSQVILKENLEKLVQKIEKLGGEKINH